MNNLFLETLGATQPKRLGLLVNKRVNPNQMIIDKRLLQDKAKGNPALLQIFNQLYGGKNVL